MDDAVVVPPTGLRCTATDLWVVSQTVWGEARDQGRAGQWAVAWVIRNRQEWHRRWQGQPLAAICMARLQFAPWSHPLVVAAMKELSLDRADFVACLQAVVGVLGGLVPSNVGRATHFYAPALLDRPPGWARGKVPVVQIGDHVFFEEIP